jgi:hypothetical protein
MQVCLGISVYSQFTLAIVSSLDAIQEAKQSRDFFFEDLVRFPNNSVRVIRESKGHRTDADVKPPASNIGRDVPPFIADAVAHFSAPLVSIQLAATSQSYVSGPSFDSKDLADLDIEYRHDDSGSQFHRFRSRVSLCCSLSSESSHSKLDVSLNASSGEGGGSGGGKGSPTVSRRRMASGGSFGAVPSLRATSTEHNVLLGKNRLAQAEDRTKPFDALLLDVLKPVLARAQRLHFTALADERTSLLRLIQPSYRYIDTEQQFCNRTKSSGTPTLSH